MKTIRCGMGADIAHFRVPKRDTVRRPAMGTAVSVRKRPAMRTAVSVRKRPAMKITVPVMKCPAMEMAVPSVKAALMETTAVDTGIMAVGTAMPAVITAQVIIIPAITVPAIMAPATTAEAAIKDRDGYVRGIVKGCAANRRQTAQWSNIRI